MKKQKIIGDEIMKQIKVKRIAAGAVICVLIIVFAVLTLLWNHYLNKNSLLGRFLTKQNQEVYLLGTFHTNHFNKWLNYSMEDMLSVVENVAPDVVFIEAREEYFQEYNVVDGPIDMNVVYSYCLDKGIRVEKIDWWEVDNNYQSNTTSTLRDDQIFRKINDKLQQLEEKTTVLVVCGAGHFYPQVERFCKEGFEKQSIDNKKSYFEIKGEEFTYPPSAAEVWEKRAYFYAYTYPGIISMDESLEESIKIQFTGGDHDAFYRQQMEYCKLFEENILYKE